MSARLTNLLLAVATVLALLTGFAAFLFGTPVAIFAVAAHGAIALSLLVLTRPKTWVARRGWSRNRRGRATSALLGVMATAALGSGITQAIGLADRLGPFTTMQIHVATGLATVSLILIHMLDRPVSPKPSDLGRRNLLRAGTVLTGGVAAWLVTEALFDLTDAPGGSRRFTGSHEIGEASRVPVTQWTNDRVQRLDAGHEVTVGLRRINADALSEESVSFEATLDCTSGWYTTQMWQGVALSELLETHGKASILVRSVSGYWRRFPASQADRLWLTVGMAGEPLSPGHGGPIRLVAPSRRGYWWVKWVSSVELDDTPPWWQPPLPTA